MNIFFNKYMLCVVYVKFKRLYNMHRIRHRGKKSVMRKHPIGQSLKLSGEYFFWCSEKINALDMICISKDRKFEYIIGERFD